MPAFTIRQSTLRGGDTLRGLPVVVAPRPTTDFEFAPFAPFERVLRVVPVEVRGELLLIGRVEGQLTRTATIRAPLVLRGRTLGRLRIAGLVQGDVIFDGRVTGEVRIDTEAEDWLLIDTDDWPVLGLPWR